MEKSKRAFLSFAKGLPVPTQNTWETVSDTREDGLEGFKMVWM